MSPVTKGESSAPTRSAHIYRALPEIWALLAPRKALLAFGLALMAVNRVAGLVLPASTKWLVDDVIGKHRHDLLLPIVLAVLVATVIQGITSFALMQSLSKEAQRMIADLRRKLHAHVSRLPVSFYDATKTGNLVSRIMQDVEGVRNLLGTGLIDFIGGLLTAALSLVVLMRISVTMTGLALLFFGLFAIAVRKALAWVRPIFRERSVINAEVTGRLTESLAGVRVVKGYGAERTEQAVISAGVERLLQNVLRTLTATSVMTLSSSVVLGVVGAIIMYVGARQVLTGTLSVGGFFTYTLFLGFLVIPVMQVVSIGTQISEAIAGLDRSRELLSHEPEDLDPRRTVTLPAIYGSVRFDNVCFAYNVGEEVLHDICFTAVPDTVTALVGSSGSGKSTVTGLIAAFYKATRGAVYVDGVDLSTMRLDSYRQHLGIVLQESFLFDGSILDNVAFSRPDAGREKILDACRIAGVNEFAERFPDGYNTIVGERGVKLSGGQRQRISIARAILADPRILILDEATSSLDSVSEQWIQEGLSYLMRGRTTFVIAHRLSTIRLADQILVLESGHIVERGTHSELLFAKGRYHDLYTRQYGAEANLFLSPGEGDKEAEPVTVPDKDGTIDPVSPIALRL